MLFEHINKYCRENSTSLDQLVENLRHKTKVTRELWKSFTDAIQWKGPARKLQKRFVKLCDNQTLSVREGRLLLRLYSQAKSASAGKEIDWDSILYYFPGKKVELLKEHCNESKAPESPISLQPIQSFEEKQEEVTSVSLPENPQDKGTEKESGQTLTIKCEIKAKNPEGCFSDINYQLLKFFEANNLFELLSVSCNKSS